MCIYLTTYLFTYQCTYLFTYLLIFSLDSFHCQLFQPFDTRDLNIYNKKECKLLYEEVKNSVEDGLQV